MFNFPVHHDFFIHVYIGLSNVQNLYMFDTFEDIL